MSAIDEVGAPLCAPFRPSQKQKYASNSDMLISETYLLRQIRCRSHRVAHLVP
jgi:hypothetical protein